jgi:membrane protease YdiL (CAAX protease family)
MAEAEKKARREVAVYFALAYGVSAILWLPVITGFRRSTLWFSIGTFGPTIAALVSQRIFGGDWRAARLWGTWRGLLTGTAAGVGLIFAAALSAAFLMTRSGFDRWEWAALAQIGVVFPRNLLGGPLGEEAGWRGYALPRLQRQFHPVAAALILGFLWANWHLPLMAAHVYNVTWWQFTMMTMATSVFLSAGFNLSGGSVLCAVLAHGFYNVGTGIILNDMIGKATLYSNEVQHQVLWIAYCGVAAIVCLVTKGRLFYRDNRREM